MLEMQLKAAAGVPDSDSGDCLLYTANHARVSCGLWGLLGMQLLRSGLNQAVIKIRVMTGIRVQSIFEYGPKTYIGWLRHSKATGLWCLFIKV